MKKSVLHDSAINTPIINKRTEIKKYYSLQYCDFYIQLIVGQDLFEIKLFRYTRGW